MATRSIVPRATGEGGIGTTLLRWATAFINAITCTTINALTLAAAAVGFTIAGGTTSKTLTVTADTDLDEAVTMSSKAPKTATIGGDGTAGRLLRSVTLTIEDGTEANTVKCALGSKWNGAVQAAVDNVAKGSTTGIFTLSADGYILTIELNNVVGVLLCQLKRNTSAFAPAPVSDSPAGDIAVYFCTIANIDFDITTIASGKVIIYEFVYVTSA